MRRFGAAFLVRFVCCIIQHSDIRAGGGCLQRIRSDNDRGSWADDWGHRLAELLGSSKPLPFGAG